MGSKDEKKKSGRNTTKRKHESSSSSLSSSSSSTSSSSSSLSSESSDSDETKTSPLVQSTKKVKVDGTEKQVDKMYFDDFDVPSRDYNPSAEKKRSSSECERKKNRYSKNKSDRKRDCADEKFNCRRGFEERRDCKDESFDVAKYLNKEKEKIHAEENTNDEKHRERSTNEKNIYRGGRNGDEGTDETRRNWDKEKDFERSQDDRTDRRKRNRDEKRDHTRINEYNNDLYSSDNKDDESRERRERRGKNMGKSKSSKGNGDRMDKNVEYENNVERKNRGTRNNEKTDCNNKVEKTDRSSDNNKVVSDWKLEKEDAEAGRERGRRYEDKKVNADGLDEIERRRSNEKAAEKADRSREKENKKNRTDVKRKSDRHLRRDTREERKRGTRKSASPKNDSVHQRNRREDERFSWRRGDYNYDGNQSMMRRYWDNEPKENVRRKRRHESAEQVLVGERFYGEDRRKAEKSINRPPRERENKKETSEMPPEDPANITQAQKRTVDLLTSKTGGAYIPPAKLRMMQAEITDKSGAAYQRIAWEALKKSIHGHINKINTSNIGLITRELLRENIVRGRGLLARSIIQAQAASPTFTSVYAALTAVVNSKFPNIGELLLRRLVIQFKRGFRRNNKQLCISAGTFIAHLMNQRVAHEILALEFLTLLVETPTDDSIEVAIAFLKECGMKLTEVSRKGIEAIFEMLRNILHEGQLDKRVQYMIEVMFQIRKDGFKDHEAVNEELDLVEEENQYTHLITLDEAMDSQDILNVFKFDPDYVANEEKYKQLSKEILDTDGSGSESEGNDDDDEAENSEDEGSSTEASAKEGIIVDNTETNLTALRRTIYLTIHSSLDFEECAHKLMKMQLKPGQEIELCHMFLDCCAEMRTYEKFFGLLAGRFCAINRMYVTPFEQIFKDSYDTIHRLDTNKLRNVSKFFAHLLFTDSISWGVLNCIRLNEEDTTSSSRIFIKILFQELSEYMGLSKLNQRVKDVTLQEAFDGLFPRDDPKNTRFAINFFTSIGLGGLTDDLREHLKNRPKPVPVPPITKKTVVSSSSSSSSSSWSSSSSTSNSDSSSKSSDSSSSEEERTKKKKKKKKNKNKRTTTTKRKYSILPDNGKGSSGERKDNAKARKQRNDRKESKDSRFSKKNSKKK